MSLIPLLTAARHAHGCLTEPVLRQVAKDARVPLHRVQQVVSFYPHFRTAPLNVTLLLATGCPLASSFST
jgi:NADH:ubiquinone oxidoreductase subunit E